MSEKTILVVPGNKRLTVPRPLKRSLQIAAAVALTAGVALAILVGNGLLVPRGHLLQGWDVWVDLHQPHRHPRHHGADGAGDGFVRLLAARPRARQIAKAEMLDVSFNSSSRARARVTDCRNQFGK